MTRITILLAALLLLANQTRAQKLTPEERQIASDLYKQFTAAKDDPPARTKIVEEMIILGSAVAKVIHPIIDREYRTASTRYRSQFLATAKTLAKQKNDRDSARKIQELRTKIQSLRKMPALTKENVKLIGDPALEELRELTRLKPSDVLAASEALPTARQQLTELGKQRNLTIDALVLTELEEFDPDTFQAEEQSIASNAMSIDRDALKILEQNKKLAAEVEPAEALAVADLNDLRILVGLRPCLIDPKLCAASRGHSEDMAEKGFFAHDSPVPGKKTPWMRAKLEGTSASSENIYAGSADGKSANRAWWYSPGHHKNMLAPSPRRVGMGLHGSHWTQMFGG